MIDYSVDEDVDLFVCAGDLFDKNTTINSEEYNQAVRLIGAMSDVAPVVMIYGNHDPAGSLDVFKYLKGRKYSISVYDKVEEVETFEQSYSQYHMLVLPFIGIKSFSFDANNVAETFKRANKHYKEAVRGFIDKPFAKRPKFIVGHFSVYGAELANSERITSNDLILSVDDFDGNVDAVMLGHIHKRDQKIFDGKNIRYPGSHYRLNFGEKAQPGFVIWDIDDGRVHSYTVDTPARDMAEFCMSVDETEQYIKTGKLPFNMPENADVKVNVEIKEGAAHLFDRESLKGLHVGGGDLKVGFKTIAKESVRSKDIGSKKSVPEKVKEWAKLVGIKKSGGLVDKIEIAIDKTGVY